MFLLLQQKGMSLILLIAGYTGALYGTYATDSLYLETALKHRAVLMSLDEKDLYYE